MSYGMLLTGGRHWHWLGCSRNTQVDRKEIAELLFPCVSLQGFTSLAEVTSIPSPSNSARLQRSHLMNTTNTAIVPNQAELTKAAKKANSAAKARQRPGKATVIKVEQNPALEALQAKVDPKSPLGALAASLGDMFGQGKKAKATKAPKAEAEAGKGVFGAIAGSLSSDEVEAAEQAAIAAIATAKKPAKKSSGSLGTKANLTLRYSLGAYNGKTGAMYAFIMRCGTLGDTFSREDAVTSIVAKPAHDKLSTRAHALDYFAWAARHGLLVVAQDQSVPAAPVATPAKKAKKGGKKA